MNYIYNCQSEYRVKNSRITIEAGKFRYIFLVLLFLVAAAGNLAGQFVTVDNTSSVASTAGSSITLSHATGSSADRLMLVGISNKERDVTNVTYNGTALSFLGEERSVKNAYTEIWSPLL